MNTTEFFIYCVTAICPDRPFIVFEGRQWSFVQFNERVNRLANAFRELGIQKGDRIGMLQVNCPPVCGGLFCSSKNRRNLCSIEFQGPRQKNWPI